MLDPAIVLALRDFPALPPHFEAADERSWLPDEVAKAERRLRAIVDSQTAALQDWTTRTKMARRLIDAWPPGESVSDADMLILSDLIEDIEALAENKARRSSKAEKGFAKTLKRLSALDPALAAVYRTYARRIAALDKDAVDSMLDNALYLRAVRSEHQPDRGEGPAFDDPSELQAYLKAML